MATRLHSARPGQSAVEIALIIGLVALVGIGSFMLAGEGVRDALCHAAEGLGAGCSTLLSEDFSDISDWQILGGKWNNTSGQLCTPGGGSRIYRPLDRSDYAINVGTANMTSGNGYGIFFRDSGGTNNFNGYSFQYDRGYYPGGFLIRKWVNGKEIAVPIAFVQMPNYNWYNVNRQVRLEVKGDTFTAFIDGQQVLQTRDNTYTSGGIGFRSWGSPACFDNLTVERP